MFLRATVALWLVASACVQGDEITVDEPEPGIVEASAVAQLDNAATMELGQPTDEDVCGLLPCDGPCSLACDYDALVAEYVPSGTCVVFSCELTDGRTFGLHACHGS